MMSEPEESSIFPINPTIEECRLAIKNAPGFRELVKNDCTIFNYDYAFKGSFPDPNEQPTPELKRMFAIRRECRGIIFHTQTGKLLSRRFHKFFNVNELEETQEDKINTDRPHWILEKMDGCLMTPLYSDGKVRWATKSGVTDVSTVLEEEYLPKSTIDYVSFAQTWMDKGYTPLFEWCSYRQQIVLEYDEDMLVLTAMRNNSTGNYLTYEELLSAADRFSVPVTKKIEFDDLHGDGYKMSNLLEHIKKQEGIEGYVIVFENGEMYKLKTNWYVERSKKIAGSFTGSEKELWKLILEQKIDDFAEALGPKRKERLEELGMQLFAALERSAAAVNAVVEDAKQRGLDRKEFARELQSRISNKDPLIKEELRGVYFAVYGGKRAFDQIVDFVYQHINNSNKLDRCRHIVAEGIKISLS